MKRILKFLVLGVIAVVFIGTFVFLYRKSQEVPVVYQIDSPARMTIIKKTVATGKVIPRREIEVKSQVSGVVERLYVAAGQTISKGTIIARISLRPNMPHLPRGAAVDADHRSPGGQQTTTLDRPTR
jgi:HlyD family secretion protein